MYNNFTLTKINILNLLIASSPLVLILGNLATNINIFFISLLGLIIFKKEIFLIKKKIIGFLLYGFFLYLIISTVFNNLSFLDENTLYKENIIKSLLYLRYLLIFLVINKLIEKKQFNTKIFFISCAFFSLVVSIDILIQFILKKNIIGFPIINNKPSSFFGEENIAGGFLQRFILFLNFYLVVTNKIKINSKFLILIIFFICFFPLIMTGNKMPILLYPLSLIIFLLLEKQIKKLFIVLFFVAITLFSFSKIDISERLHVDIKLIFTESFKIITEAPELFIKNKPLKNYEWHTGYLAHFNTGIQIWKKNKIFGNGLKSFRIKCTDGVNQTCNTHPHNYIIELLVDVGIVGVFILLTLFLIGILNFFNYYFQEKKFNLRLTSSIFFILIFIEFFPLRSSGSFFTTSNSYFIFLILPIFFNVKNLKKL